MYYANKHEFVNETPKDSRNFINSRNSRIFSNTRNRNRYAKQSNSTSENYDKFCQKTNLLDKSGRTSRCVICKSIYHWANDCPNKVQDTSDDVNITLFSQEMHECYMTKFVGETLNCAVLDSGCTKNVCGESWLTNYLDTLTESDRSKVVVEKSSNSFRFGNGKSLNSEKMVTFPAQIGKEDIMIKSDVIDSDLPLLLSKSAMKKANVKIDFSNDVVNMLNQKINIVFTGSGHYAVPISKTSQLVEEFHKRDKDNNVYLSINELKKSHIMKKLLEQINCIVSLDIILQKS